jgi:hypothetical protein
MEGFPHMISPVSNAAPTQAAAKPSAAQQAAAQSTSQATKQPAPQAAPADTVQISSAAQQLLKEAIETPAQTAQEAAGGDAQARRLLASEAAARAQ